MDGLELHSERLATTDDKGRRVYLYPADVRGKLRQRRNWIQAGLILFFLILPWLQINGRQALLLDVSRRHFEIFGLTLRAHNAPLFFFVLAMAGFGLFFVTAIWGRVWCGWACPQTVFVEGIFRRIERIIEGTALERRKLDTIDLNFDKIWKRTLKWALYILASLGITHSFLAYFVGAKPLINMVTSAPTENWTSFLFILFSTGIILFDFAWFREQFCIIACPYGRFQSVLMDEHSMIVAYDQERGEPRRSPQNKALAKNHSADLGDCVNCYRCVQVCPTGIDIRRGTQLECVACTSCIDACDEVMTKLKKPTGLIRYDSHNGLAKLPVKRLRIRTGAYLAIIMTAFIALTYFLSTLKPVDIAVLRAKEIPYSVSKLGDGTEIVINHMKLELSNQTEHLHEMSLALPIELTQKGVEIVIARHPYPIEPSQVERANFFLKVPKGLFLNGMLKAQLTVLDRDTVTNKEDKYEKELTIVGPF
jgi:cytochrome c oxidase accessory protein FixG